MSYKSVPPSEKMVPCSASVKQSVKDVVEAHAMQEGLAVGKFVGNLLTKWANEVGAKAVIGKDEHESGD